MAQAYYADMTDGYFVSLELILWSFTPLYHFYEKLQAINYIEKKEEREKIQKEKKILLMQHRTNLKRDDHFPISSIPFW